VVTYYRILLKIRTVLELLPEALTGIANRILADDEPTTISFQTESFDHPI